MNRMTVSQGALSNGAIAGGTQVAYDAAGQRMSVSTMSSGLVWSGWKAVIKGGGGQVARYADEPGGFEEDGYIYIWSQSGPVRFSGKVIETYSYTADGLLETVSVAGEGGTAESGWPAGNGVMGSPVLRASYAYDAQGRLASQIDYENATTMAYSRTNIVYDAAGRVTSETTAARQSVTGSSSATTTTTYTTYGYGVGTGAGYALGAVVTIDADTWQGGSDTAVPDTRTTYGYDWFDGAVQSSIQYRPDMNNAATYNTSFGLTASGQVGSASIADGRPRSVAFTLDAYGQAVRRDETDNNTSLGDPHQLWYRFNGRQLGTIGNDTLEDGDYAGSIAARQTAQGTGPFRGGQNYGGGFARFGEAYVPYTSYAQGAGGGSYSAEGGETLSQLAAQLWGDASLWYLLAEANGMGSDASLVQGQAITIPQGVTRNSNTATTFKPFDPAETLGNLNPTTPKPQKKAKNCGVFGQIIVAAIAIAIMVALPNPASIGQAITFGASSSAISQYAGVALGIQEDINFKGVALAGITAGLSYGLGKIPGLDGAKGFAGAAQDAARGALANAGTQGIALATGMQSKFDFAGVAAAGAVAGMGSLVGGALGISATNRGSFGARLAATNASALAGAATRSVLTGTSFGDNIIAVLPDVIAQTLGGLAEDVIAHRGRGDGGFFSQVPEQVNELAMSGAGVQAELAALVAGGPSLLGGSGGSYLSMVDGRVIALQGVAAGDGTRNGFIPIPTLAEGNAHIQTALSDRQSNNPSAYMDGSYHIGVGGAAVGKSLRFLWSERQNGTASYAINIDGVGYAIDSNTSGQLGDSGVSVTFGRNIGAATEGVAAAVAHDVGFLGGASAQLSESFGWMLTAQGWSRLANGLIGAGSDFLIGNTPVGSAFSSDIRIGATARNSERGVSMLRGAVSTPYWGAAYLTAAAVDGRSDYAGRGTVLLAQTASEVLLTKGAGRLASGAERMLAAETAVARAPGARMVVGGVDATEIAGRLSPSQMAALQAEQGTEFAQVYLTGPGRNGGGGTYYLIQGTEGGVQIPIGSNVRWINHSHPEILNGNVVPLRASGADRNVLRLLQRSGSPQMRSQVVPQTGEPFYFKR